MKKNPSIEAARKYLSEFLIFPVNSDKDWYLLHKRHRLWLGKKSKTIVHICKPRNLLHYIRGDTSKYGTGPFIGEVVDGGFWHTQEISYRCMECRKKFSGGVAFAIRLGVKDKEKFE